jgi:hypothetical protein
MQFRTPRLPTNPRNADLTLFKWTADAGKHRAAIAKTGGIALDGRFRPIKGASAMAALAAEQGQGILIPADNAVEAAVVSEVEVLPHPDRGRRPSQGGERAGAGARAGRVPPPHHHNNSLIGLLNGIPWTCRSPSLRVLGGTLRWWRGVRDWPPSKSMNPTTTCTDPCSHLRGKGPPQSARTEPDRYLLHHPRGDRQRRQDQHGSDL